MPCLPTAVFSVAFLDLSSCSNLCRLLRLLLQAIQQAYFSTVVHFSFIPIGKLEHKLMLAYNIRSNLGKGVFDNFMSDYLVVALGHYRRRIYI